MIIHYSQQLYGAWMAAGLSAAAHGDGRVTFVCPKCAAASGLTVTAHGASCPRCRWEASGELWAVAATARVEKTGEGAAPALRARSLGELKRPEEEPEKELIKHRFLSRGGGALIVGPTGVGKSVLIMQKHVLWGLGREAFGIQPARPLRSLIIQAENDDGDMAEMRDGVCVGLRLSPADRKKALEMVHVYQETAQVSAGFFDNMVGPLLAEHRPDLVTIDPALAYIGGESNSQKDLGAFLRNGLNPL